MARRKRAVYKEGQLINGVKFLYEIPAKSNRKGIFECPRCKQDWESTFNDIKNRRARFCIRCFRDKETKRDRHSKKTMSVKDIPISDLTYLKRILYKVARYTDYKSSVLKEHNKKVEIVKIRQVYFYIAVKNSNGNVSYKDIGRLVNKSDKAVFRGVYIIKKLIDKKDPFVLNLINKVSIPYIEYESASILYEKLNLTLLLRTGKVYIKHKILKEGTKTVKI